MTQATLPTGLQTPDYQTQAGIGLQPVLPYLKRSPYIPLFFLPSVMLCGLSMLADGLPLLTDAGMVYMTLVCLWLLIKEVILFPKRFGIGGLTLFGGVLVFFCHDYIKHWLGFDFNGLEAIFPAEVVARAAFFHTVWVTLLSAGLLIPLGRTFEKPFRWLPEPPTQAFYFWLCIGLFIFGISPYFLFVNENFFDAIYKDFTAGRSGETAAWTVGRTGNVNYSFGAYVAQILDVGEFGGLLAAFVAILVVKNPVQKAILWSIWAFWFFRAFGTGTRGAVVFHIVPILATYFVFYSARAADRGQLFSLRAFIFTGVVGFVGIVSVAIQGQLRVEGFRDLNVSEINAFEVKGNEMFTTTLNGFALIPDSRPPYYSSNPFEPYIRPIPQFLFWAAIGPIPRAIWQSKPLDPVWSWYNRLVTGEEESARSTTISNGAVGWWYFRFGAPGVVQGAILFGLIFGLVERLVQHAQGRPFLLLIALAFATWLFRTFRDPNFHNLYPILIAAVVLTTVIYLFGGYKPRFIDTTYKPQP